MMDTLRGRAWRFEGLYDVDWEICPVEHMRAFLGPTEASYEEQLKDLGRYCLTRVDPDFPKKVQPGDIIIAGEGFGYGHDHDHACMSVRGAGIAAILCEAANINFKRNSIHHGLPVVEVKGILSAAAAGDELEIDLSKGEVRNLTSGKVLAFNPLPDFIIEIIEAGGLYQHLANQVRNGKYE